MKKTISKKIGIFFVSIWALYSPVFATAEADFNPHFIISDLELQDARSWARDDVQKFLDSKDSYLRNLQTEDASGTIKTAADIIYDTSQTYKISPKYLLVTLQKEQSLVTDDAPSQKQLDWATGYGVCDSCSLSDPKVLKFKGFGKQVDNAGGIMRWYYNNLDQPFIKKANASTQIDNVLVTPESWATAFLYTYTPHLHGNKNFWRIWETWFEQVYPNGTLLKSASSSEYWLIRDGQGHKFKTQTALITRSDPRLAITVPDINLNNYSMGPDIAFPNYSILKTSTSTYLLDYDTLRPFASDEVVRKLGYHPDELIEVADTDISGYPIGSTITATTIAPLGVIYQIVDLHNALYLLKNGVLYPITDKSVIHTNFKSISIEKHKAKELAQFTIADIPLNFKDGTLLMAKDSVLVYVIDKGARRRIADEDTFVGLGYKRSNIQTVELLTLLSIPEGEQLFYNNSLASSKNKFLGDSEAPVVDLFNSSVPSYLVAEFPSGRIISGKNIDVRRPIASLTKLVTAYEAVSQNFKLSKGTIYRSSKHQVDNNVLKLRDGDTVKNSDLLNALLIGSVNNSGRMIASATGLSEEAYVNAMNQRLEEWGADNTALADVTGLSENNKSTARDLLKIFTKVLSKKILMTALGEEKYTVKITRRNKTILHPIKNTNQIFSVKNRDYKILASKTGYTEEAGAVMIMLIETRQAKKQYVVITMANQNYPKRFEEPHKIAEWIATNRAVATAE